MLPIRIDLVRTLGVLAVLGLAGCGRLKTEAIGGDGGGDDDDEVMIDAPAPPGPVTVTLLTSGARRPMPGVPVVFFAPDGAPSEPVMTDGDGVARAEVAAGSAAAAFIGGTASGGVAGGTRSFQGRAVLDLQPGDAIVLAGQWYPDGSPTATMTLSLPETTGASSYSVETPCGYFGGGIKIDILFYPGCESDSFALTAFAFIDGGPLRTLVKGDIAFAPGGTAVLTGETWRAATTERVTVTDLPGQLSQLSGRYLFGRMGTSSFTTYTLNQVSRDAPGTSATYSPQSIDELDAAAFEIYLRNSQGGFGDQRLLRWRSPIGDDFSLSLADQLLPWLGPVAYDSDNRAFSWAQAGDGAWDATYINMQWSRVDPITGQQDYGQWQVVAPPGSDRAALPTLPEELAAWLPTDVDGASAVAFLMESSAIEGWDAARQLGHDGGYDDQVRLAPGDTTTRFSTTGFLGKGVR